MKKMLFVMNPRAGIKKANRCLAEIIGIFNAGGYEVSAFMTAAQGDAARVVEERAGEFDLVVCVGGDGTLNETVTGLLRSGVDRPIGYIPSGSTNDFAASLHLPGSPAEAARYILEAEPEEYDVGEFAGRYFSYVASFGAFTRASYATSQNVKNSLGHLAYILEGIQELSQIHKIHMRIDADGERIEDDFLFGAISNSTSVGGLLTLDPRQVDMADGKFELLLVRMPKNAMELHECILALRDQRYDCSMVTFRAVSDLTIFADPQMPWTLDGEKEEGHEVIRVRNRHHGIRLMTRKEKV